MSGLESMSENNTEQDVLIQAARAIISTYNFTKHFKHHVRLGTERKVVCVWSWWWHVRVNEERGGGGL